MLYKKLSKTLSLRIQKINVFSLSFFISLSSCSPIAHKDIIKDSGRKQNIVQKQDTVSPLKELRPKILEQKQDPLPVDLKKVFYHPNCLAQCPSGAANDNILVDHDLIVLSANINTKFADWVAYKIEARYIQGPSRQRNWKKDPQLSDQVTFIPQDYKGMSQDPYFFDRGHQAPLAAFKNHPKWFVVNYLSNITPQKKYLNQGPWNVLESKERILAQKETAVHVLTGPYYDKDKVVEGPPQHRISYTIPSGYWKIIALKKDNHIATASFIFPQDTPRAADYCHHLVNISTITEISGLTFFNDNVPVQEQGLTKQIGCKTAEESQKSNIRSSYFN